MMRTRHRWKWKDVRRWLTDPHRAVATHQRGRDRTVQPRDDTDHPVPLPGQQDPQPLGPRCLNHTRRQKPWRARCVETRTAGSASGLGKRTGSNPGTAPQADSSVWASCG